MRTTALAMLIVFGSVVATPVMAQPQPTAPNQKTQEEADKGIKTRNSGESGLVGDQEKAGSTAHPPGQSPADTKSGNGGSSSDSSSKSR
jgi:hypothetical protein